MVCISSRLTRREKAVWSGVGSILVQGMLGLGDNLHQRAVVRRLMQQVQRVYLETVWPSIYHDLVGPKLHLVRKVTALRTQSKNSQRQLKQFGPPAPKGLRTMRVWYTPDEVRRVGSFIAAMSLKDGPLLRIEEIALPIPDEWEHRAQVWRERWGVGKPGDKPIMLYRPLVDRVECLGCCAARNPDPVAYAHIVQSIRRDFFVVSVADLEPKKEWLVGIDIGADVECHAGELEFEVLAALSARAGLVYCSPGFALVLAQAVGAPLIAVVGGHESGRFYDHGLLHNLIIDPLHPCECFKSKHACDKRIDLPYATLRAQAFVATYGGVS